MDVKDDSFKVKVFKDKVFLERENIDERLLANLRFNSVVETACSNLVDSIDGTFDFKISTDGKDVVIMSEGILRKGKNKCGENLALKTITISLEGDSMVVDEAFGWLDDRESLNQMGVDLHQKYSCALSTSYKHSIFDNDGLEISNSFFGDFLFLLNDEYTIDVLKQRVLTSSHRPDFYSNRLAKLPTFCGNAVSRCVYRDYENLAIAYVMNATDVKQNSFFEVENSICEVFDDWPHDLRVLTEKPIAVWDKKTYKYVTKYKYSNQTLEEAKNDLREKFAENVESSKIKECYPEYYQALVFHVNNSKQSKRD